MTKQEILQAVQRNIAGQGSMVDISGKLPEILAGIAESAKFANKTKITAYVYAKKLNGRNGRSYRQGFFRIRRNFARPRNSVYHSRGRRICNC